MNLYTKSIYWVVLMFWSHNLTYSRVRLGQIRSGKDMVTLIQIIFQKRDRSCYFDFCSYTKI